MRHTFAAMNQKLLLSPIALPDLVSEITREVTRAMRAELSAIHTTQPAAPEELLSRDETARLLGICERTLHDYTDRGLVNGYKIGSCVRYKRSEVIGSLNNIKSRRQ